MVVTVYSSTEGESGQIVRRCIYSIYGLSLENYTDWIKWSLKVEGSKILVFIGEFYVVNYSLSIYY
jgi:hypothetical protein